jgi:photosystem II stability/assembly factor-like uncharacterized protein
MKIKTSILILVIAVLNSVHAQTWSKQVSNYDSTLLHVQFLNDNLGFVSGIHGTILKTTDGGNNWVRKNTGINTDLALVQFVSPSVGYASGGFSGGSDKNTALIKTSNGGDSWTSLTVQTNKCGGGMYFINADTGFYAYADSLYKNSRITKTTDGGLTWNDVYLGDDDTQVWISYFHFTDKNNGFASANHGRIIKTSDGGNTWQVVYLPKKRLWGSGIWFFDKDTGILGGGLASPNGIFITKNGGSSWDSVNTGFNMVFKLQFTNRQNGYGLEVDNLGKGFIIKTNNGGSNWTTMPALSQHLRGVWFQNANSGYAVGDSGTILKWGFQSHLRSIKENNIQIYPNPAQNELTIIQKQNPNSQLNVFDALGQLIYSTHVIQNVTNIDISSLPNGMYYFRIDEANVNLKTGKLIILR